MNSDLFYLRTVLGSKVVLSEIPSQIVVDRKDLLFVLSFLKNHTNSRYTQVVDMTAVDHPDRNERFDLVYNLLSPTRRERIVVKTAVHATGTVDSATSLFPSTNFMEREVWDLFGIFFSNHPDLRRILTDYGFEGFPLRKDFPLTGFSEIRYSDQKKLIVEEPLEVSQELRVFDFRSPWERK